MQIKKIFSMWKLLFLVLFSFSFANSASAVVYVDANTGSSNETQINTALNSTARESGGMLVVHLNAGLYMIDGPIYIGSNTILEGDSKAIIKLVNNAGWEKNIGLINARGGSASNFVIQGFEMDGNDVNQPESNGALYYTMMFLDNCVNFTVRNMYLHDNNNDGVRVFKSNTATVGQGGVNIYDNKFYRCYHNAVYLDKVSGANVYRNDIINRTNDGITVTDSNNILIYGNKIDTGVPTGGAGIQIQKTSSYMNMDKIEIYDNSISNTNLAGILVLGYNSYSVPAGAQNVNIHHNLIRNCGYHKGLESFWGGGISIAGFSNTTVENNTLDGNYHYGIMMDDIWAASPSATYKSNIRNNIVVNTQLGRLRSGSGAGIRIGNSKYTAVLQNNDVWNNVGGNYSGVTAGTGDITVNPLFASATDYHLKSKAGRWNGSSWVSDTVSSPCIDAGYASSSYANEPAPNGSRINIGRYGNTNEASKSGSSPAPAPSTYTLTVNNGSGSGSYTFGTKVTIAVNPAISELVFDKWTGDTDAISTRTLSPDGTDITVYQPSVTITMPGKAITLTATYKDSPAATHVLTVNQGTGSGSYAAGQSVNISANLPSSSTKVFDKWTGDTDAISARTLSQDGTDITVYQPSVILTMPNKAITLTATYKDVIAKYYLTVNSGSGDGSYAPNTKVTVTAAPAVTGMVFDKWTGDTDYLSSLNSATTTLTMPAKAINITAHYIPVTAPETTYSLLVNFGSGDGKYTQGAKITITADTPTGKVFDKWTGDTTYLSSTTSATATVTMPNKAITLNATYKTIAVAKYVLTVNQGTGDGSYAAGTQVTIKADNPSASQAFDKWTGDTDYISSVTSSTATVTMPDKAITLTATYKSQDSSLPDGTLIKTPDSNKVYVVIGGEKKWLSTPEVFEQMGYAWSSIRIIANLDMANYTDFEDNLIRAIGEINVYLVINGTKRHIPNPQVFLSYGFSWNDIKEVTKEAKMRYKDAYLIRESGKQEVYYLNPQGIRKHIPSQAVFDSYHDNWSDVQIISSEEMKAHPVSNLIQLEGSGDVYLLENNVKRHISSPQTFSKYQLDWNHIIAVNRTEFDWYKTGNEVR